MFETQEKKNFNRPDNDFVCIRCSKICRSLLGLPSFKKNRSMPILLLGTRVDRYRSLEDNVATLKSLDIMQTTTSLISKEILYVIVSWCSTLQK